MIACYSLFKQSGLSLRVDHMLLISGTGRKSGKTTLACQLIRKFGRTRPIIGLKISSHFHEPEPGLHVVKTNKAYKIFEEKDNSSGKDSSRMLQAGAVKSYYIQSKAEGLEHAINYFLEIISPANPIICESPALKSYVAPGVYVITYGKESKSLKNEVVKEMEIADLLLQFTGTFNDNEVSSINLNRDKWIISPIGD